MNALIGRLVEASYRYAAVMVATLLLLSGAGAYFVAEHISVDTEVGKLINPNLPWRRLDAEFDRAFPGNVDLLAVIIDGRTPELAEKAAAQLAQRLASQTTLFRSVRRPDGGPFFRKNGILFLQEQEVQDFADRLIAAQPLIGTLAADPSLRGVFDALDLAAQGVILGQAEPNSLDAPFTAIAEATEAALAGRYAPLSWQTLLGGRQPDPQELRRFILAQPMLDYRELQSGAQATAAIRQAAQDLGLTAERGIQVRITGPVALADEEFATLSNGAGFSAALSLALLCLWLFLALRSARLVIAILTTLLVGLVACATFAVGVVGALNPISVAFAVLFVGIAVDFGIQFSVRYRDERHQVDDRIKALRRTASGIGRPLTIAAAATAVGFLSFVPTAYTGVSDLGLIAGFGMVAALLLNLTLLPALLALLRPSSERRSVGFAALAPVNRFLRRQRALVIGLTVAATVAGVAALPWLRFDFNPLNLKDPHTESVATLLDLMADPGTTPYTIDILTPSPQAAADLAARIGALPEVSRAITVGSYVPEDQPPKLAILADAKLLLGPTLSPPQIKVPPDEGQALAAIAHAGADIGKAAQRNSASAARLAKALREIAARGPAALPMLGENLASGIALPLEDLRLALEAEPVSLATLPAELRDDWVTADDRARIEVFPKGDARDNKVLRDFVAAVRRVAPDATGTPVTIQESAHTVLHAFMVAGATALAAIAVLLFLTLRRLSDVLLVLAPLVLAGLLTLATSVTLGLPLNFANIIALPLLLGIGVAFDIYFVMRWRAGHDDLLESSTARAILFSALTTGTAFGSLALSSHPGTADMGKLLTLALLYTLICTFFVLPALLGPVRRAPEDADLR